MDSSKGWSSFTKENKCVKENWHENKVKQHLFVLNKLKLWELEKLYSRVQKEFIGVISKPLLGFLKTFGEWKKKFKKL